MRLHLVFHLILSATQRVDVTTLIAQMTKPRLRVGVTCPTPHSSFKIAPPSFWGFARPENNDSFYRFIFEHSINTDVKKEKVIISDAGKGSRSVVSVISAWPWGQFVGAKGLLRHRRVERSGLEFQLPQMPVTWPSQSSRHLWASNASPVDLR